MSGHRLPRSKGCQPISKNKSVQLDTNRPFSDQVLEYDKHPKKWIHHAELAIFWPNDSFAFGSVDDDSFNIQNWVMSCRFSTER